jgi:hypothetical protein
MDPRIIFQPRIYILFCFFLLIQFSFQTLAKGIKEFPESSVDKGWLINNYAQAIAISHSCKITQKKTILSFKHSKFAISMKTAYFYCRANTLYQIDTQYHERNEML